MAKKFPIHPPHPERICWGCDRYCFGKDLACGNGTERVQHPVETLGDDWYTVGNWEGLDIEDRPTDKAVSAPATQQHEVEPSPIGVVSPTC
ncbi:DUF3079 domain-containing protein [Pigmentiphaga aceris]|uniref:DUF3079 domain-containing protein n=1 Tax=Pigmentiphaga aceris TaxID=1940612 RepID=A0A5C0AUE1_9BURK|nr:DUF3079 domain-containing protein [Pigmentiphaga aceris]QEI05928.1 DUF3079 domain-containing protein [Pigmentiphaga aceris]